MAPSTSAMPSTIRIFFTRQFPWLMDNAPQRRSIIARPAADRNSAQYKRKKPVMFDC